MRTLKDILIVILLLVLVTMTCLQEGDVLDLKHQAFMQTGGLVSLAGGLASMNGGLLPTQGGLDLQFFRAATTTVAVQVRHAGLDVWGNPLSRPDTVEGTAVFVSDNVLLTAKHVVEHRIDTAAVAVICMDGRTYTAIEVLEDVDDDLALIVIEGRVGPYLRIGRQPTLGAALICIGSPLDKQLIISWARLSREKYKNQFIYDGFCNYGCSGGPIISGGRLVGIVNARLRSQAFLGFAAPIKRLDSDLMARIN